MVDPGFIAVLLRFYCGFIDHSPSWSRGFILPSKKKLNGFYKTGERFFAENPGPPKILESEKIKPIYLNKYYIPVNGFYRFFCQSTPLER